VLYAPYPENWPKYTPKDKFADWLESYAFSQDLVIWTSTSLLPTPTYDATSKRWSLSVLRSGQTVHLRPAHIVLATGTLGPPFTPTTPDSDSFTGHILHSTAYTEPSLYRRKDVLIVGSANTATDLALDLYPVASSVTLLQRGPTCVAFPGAMDAFWSVAATPGVPLAISDFKMNSVPGLVRGRLAAESRSKAVSEGKDPDIVTEDDLRRKEGLERGGYRMWDGPAGFGAGGEIYTRFAGETFRHAYLLGTDPFSRVP
jgi:cation diffusion facilitator CzcD-associated flavoprotein CzcO